MGLDFSHCNAQWAYSGFNSFRRRIAQAVGFDLDSMTGFGGGNPWGMISDPVKPLLDHSDCDGILTPAECAQVAPRLRELVADWPDDDYDKVSALMLAEGMEKAAKNGENLEFE